MGGLGSGRTGSLPIIEQGLKLDLRRLRRQGVFTPDGAERWTTLTWTNSVTGERISTCHLRYRAGPGKGWLRLKYRVTPYGREPRDIDDLFILEPFPQPFGGFRWYVVCPVTGRRCQCVYLPCGAYSFRSRRAFSCRLLYASQREDGHSRLFARARRHGEKMLRRGPPEWQRQHGDWDFPPKPPRMHWKTYCRALDRWDEAEHQADGMLSRWLQQLGGL